MSQNITKSIVVDVDGKSCEVLVEDLYFSTRQVVVGDSAEATTEAQSGTRTTWLRCHLSFSYDRTSLHPLRGCVVVDLQKLTEIQYDTDGHFTKLTSAEDLTYKTVDEVLGAEPVKSMIAKHLKSDRLDHQEDVVFNRLLGKANAIDGLPNMYH